MRQVGSSFVLIPWQTNEVLCWVEPSGSIPAHKYVSAISSPDSRSFFSAAFCLSTKAGFSFVWYFINLPLILFISTLSAAFWYFCHNIRGQVSSAARCRLDLCSACAQVQRKISPFSGLESKHRIPLIHRKNRYLWDSSISFHYSPLHSWESRQTRTRTRCQSLTSSVLRWGSWCWLFGGGYTFVLSCRDVW